SQSHSLLPQLLLLSPPFPTLSSSLIDALIVSSSIFLPHSCSTSLYHHVPPFHFISLSLPLSLPLSSLSPSPPLSSLSLSPSPSSLSLSCLLSSMSLIFSVLLSQI